MTVAKAIEERLPQYSLLYYGDIARTPYGTKSAETIIDYSLRNTEFLINKGAKLVVIACNSASSVATERLRQEFDVPIIEVVSPAAQKAAELTRCGRIGVIATRATVKSGIYEKIITSLGESYQVFSQPCPLLVPLVEEGWMNRQETKMIIRRYLHPLKDKQIDTMVLGCTHYPLLKPLIQARIGKRVTLIDSSIETANVVSAFLADHPGLATPSDHGAKHHKFYVSDLTESAKNVAEKIFGRPMELLHI